jgi:hypothetical protein
MCFKKLHFCAVFNLTLLVKEAALEPLMILVNYFG